MARPKKQIDVKLVEQLAAINCSLDEIGSMVGCSADTLGRRFADVIQKGRANGKMSLKRKQFDVAMGGNVSMLIWLGKQILGQRDTPVEDRAEQIPAPVYSINKPKVAAV